MPRAIIIACMCCFAAAVPAQSLLEEIVVTAQKREQSINDVGIAVSAFSGEQMDALGFESSTDLIAYTPGVSLAGDIGGQRAIFNIRGVVQNDYGDLAEAPVAVYVDGGYLASTQAQTFGLYDVERIEILKGPQGTLFGRNATGGLVNTITAKPTEEYTGYVEFTAARFEQYRVEAALSGPLSDTLRGRLSLLSNQQGDILENIYVDGAAPDTRLGSPGGGEDGYNDGTLALRAQLDMDIGQDGGLLLSANWADTTKSEGPYQVINTTQILDANDGVIDVIYAADDPMRCDNIKLGACVDGNFNGDPRRPVQGGDFNGNFDPDGSGDQVNKDFAFDDQNKIESWGLAATLDYDFGAVQLISITDYKRFDRLIGLDSDQTASPELIFQSDGEIKQFSQELRLSATSDVINWVAGLYYLSIDTDWIQGLAASPTAGFLAREEDNTVTDTDTDSYSFFAQVDYALRDDLVLVAGLRYVRENKTFRGLSYRNANRNDRLVEIDFSTPILEQADTSNDQNLWSAKLQLEYAPTADSLFYFGVNRGVKAGSFNAPLLASMAGFSSYKPEVLYAYEGGAKLTLLAGRAQLNASLYHYDYKNFQSFAWVNNAGVVFNEQAKFTGGEIELFTSPTRALDFVLGLSYIDAVVEDLEVAAGVFRDTTPSFTPEFQASGLLRYNREFMNGTLSAQINASYQSDTFHNSRNFTAHKIQDHVIADARLTWTDAADKWDVIFFIDNLNDSEHGIIGFDVSGFYGTTQLSYARPRTFGGTIRRRF